MIYHEGNRHLQDRFDTRRLADRIEQRLCATEIDEDDRTFIESRDMFFLATVDERGFPTCSYKGGDAGFVRVVDSRTIVFPNYDGNGMYLSTGNVSVNPNVGLLFIDFEDPTRLRVNGEASLVFDRSLVQSYPGAQFVVAVTVREVFPNCGRYIHRMQRVERSRYVPRAGEPVAVAEWKQQESYVDVLPAGDPARQPSNS
ncbi:MAG: pyridoxamine 5'-phosphate oxidase family protein [Candidatus Eremiobacteraeota bacterium]|nr:pyridoxamine 5'-phosphate oxidase family protein [Candidatus Eremiobacteraeota bacterium]